jgi:hypothetical protein
LFFLALIKPKKKEKCYLNFFLLFRKHEMGEFCTHLNIHDFCCQDCGEEFEKPRFATTPSSKSKKSKTKINNNGAGASQIYELKLPDPITNKIMEIYYKLESLNKNIPTEVRTHFAVYQAHKELAMPIPPHGVAKMLGYKNKICSKHYRLCVFIYNINTSSAVKAEEIPLRGPSITAEESVKAEEIPLRGPSITAEESVKGISFIGTIKEVNLSVDKYFLYYVKEMINGKLIPFTLESVLHELNTIYQHYHKPGVNFDVSNKPQNLAAALIYLWAKERKLDLNVPVYLDLVNLSLTPLNNLERDIRKGKITV